MQSVRKIDEAWKAALLGRLDFVDVVQRAGVKLERKVGGEYVGLCPFHADSSPSFGVNPGKGVCSCWSTCGSGDVIWFWQKATGKGFLDAVRELAAMVGMAVPGEEQQAEELGRPVVLALTAEQLAEAEAKRARRELEEGRRRAKSINQARAIWRDAAGDGRMPVVGTMPACLDGRGPNHPRLLAYFKARGVPIERLPGGELPRTLRYHGACPFETPEEEKHPRHVPAVVAAWIDDPTTKVVTGVQRIALDLAGEPRKLDTADAKRTRGSFSNGGCVPLGPRAASGLLVLCEGLETGVALQAMLGDEGTVWALVSTSGMRTFALGQQHVSDPRLGWVKQVIIAGDTDKSHAGERAAEVCVENIRKQWPMLPLAIAMVGHTAMPKSIDRDGRILDGKSVDWLDAVAQMGADEALLAFGAAAKAGEVAVAAAPDPVERRGPDAASGGGAGGGGGGGDDGGQGGADDDGDAVDDDGRPILPPEPTKRAKSILRRLFSPAKAEHAVWRLRRFGGKWWVYGRTAGVVRWREIDEEQLTALVRQEADKYVEFKKADYRPAALPMSKLGEIMHAATLWTSASGQAMPQWLPPAFRGSRPQWKPTLALDVDEEQMEVRAEDVVTLTNGLLDVGAWCRGELRMLPPSPRWFCATSLRYALPVEQLAEIDVACDEEVGTLARQLAPNWHRVIGEVLSGDGLLCSTLQEWYGYCLVPDNTLQKMLWLQGAPGSGKGTLMEGFLAMVGEEATATSTIDRLGDKYTASGFVGKLAVIVPEVHTDHRTPMGAALTMIKTITGNGPVPVEDKFEKVQPNVRLTCRLMFTPNEEPRIFDSSNALERRLLVIPTGLPVVNRDPLLYGKIRSEAVGIMLWALVGLRRLRRRGDFVQPEAGRSILDEMKRQMSPVSAFVADTCVVGAKQSVRTELLYQLYHKWCEQQGQDGAATLPVFAKQLRAALPGVAKYRQQTRVMSLHGYTGLRPKLERLDGATDEPGDYHVGVLSDAPPFSETDAMVLGAGEVAVLRAGGATLEAHGPRTPPGAEIRPQSEGF